MTFEQVPTGPAGEFLARVQAVAAGTPYRVRPTRTGFDVLRDEDFLARRVQVVDEAARSYAITHSHEDDDAGCLVATAAHQLGWTERRGTGERFSLAVALAGGGALLVMIALVVVLLLRLL